MATSRELANLGHKAAQNRRNVKQQELLNRDYELAEEGYKVQASGKSLSPVQKAAMDRTSKEFAAQDASVGKKVAAAQAGLQTLQAATGKSGGVAGGIASGALGGAATGSMFGPQGAAVGAAVGAGVGLLKAGSAKKQRKREAEAKAQQNISNIEENKASRIQNALSSMGQLMAQSLR